MILAFAYCRCDGPRWHRRLRRIILTGSRPRLPDAWRSQTLETPVDAHASTVRTETVAASVIQLAGDLVFATRAPPLLRLIKFSLQDLAYDGVLLVPIP